MRQKFLWGVAVSGHQVEGGDKNSDWSEFEKNPQNIKDGSDTKIACDFWNRYQDDIKLAKSLGANCFRISIEWSRIEPEIGKWDFQALKHYQKIINFMLKNQIEPIVTLWHFTNPLWLTKIGGWENKKSALYFKNYVKKVVSKVKNVKYWLTINEPEIYATHSYYFGDWPPEKRNFWLFFRVMRNLAKAHQTAFKIIHRNISDAKVSFANHWILFEGEDFLSRQILKFFDWFWNLRVARQFQPIDFWAINFYSRYGLEFLPWPRRVYKKDSFIPPLQTGFDYVESDPEGLYYTIKDVAKKLPSKPVLITEHGICDNKDLYRPKLVEKTAEAAAKLLKEKIPLIGVCHWSLLDNFEWAKGYTAKFGIVSVDFKTSKRKVKKSGWEFKKAAKKLKKINLFGIPTKNQS